MFGVDLYHQSSCVSGMVNSSSKWPFSKGQTVTPLTCTILSRWLRDTELQAGSNLGTTLELLFHAAPQAFLTFSQVNFKFSKFSTYTGVCHTRWALNVWPQFYKSVNTAFNANNNSYLWRDPLYVFSWPDLTWKCRNSWLLLLICLSSWPTNIIKYIFICMKQIHFCFSSRSPCLCLIEWCCLTVFQKGNRHFSAKIAALDVFGPLHIRMHFLYCKIKINAECGKWGLSSQGKVVVYGGSGIKCMDIFPET